MQVLQVGTSTLYPIAAMIGNGGDYLWSKYVNMPGQRFQSIRYNNAKDKLFVLNSAQPMTIVTLDATTGQFLSAIQDNSNLAIPSIYSKLAVGNLDTLFINLADSSNRFLALIVQGSTVLGQYSLNVLGSAQAVALTRDNSHAYFAGHSISGGNKNAVITRLDTSGNPSFTYKVIQESGQISLEFNYADVQTFGTVETFIGFATVVTTGTYYRWIILNYDTSTNSVVLSRKVNLPTQNLKMNYAKAISLTAFEAFYTVSNFNIQYYATTDHSISATTSNYGTLFSSNTYNIWEGKYDSNYGPIFVGQTNNFGGGPAGVPNQAFTKQIGLVLAWNYQYRCLGSILTSYSPSPFTITQTVHTAYTDASQISLTLTFSSYSPSAPQDNILQNNIVKVGSCRAMRGNTQITFPNVTADCASVTINHIYTQDTMNSDAAVVSANFANLDGKTDSILFTNDRGLDSLKYVYTVIAEQPNSRQTATYQFEIYLHQYDCEKVVATTSMLPDQNYDIALGDGTQVALVNWPQTYQAQCPYTVGIVTQRMEDSALMNVINKVDIATPTQFSLQTQGLTLVGTYQVQVSLYVPSVQDYYDGFGFNNHYIYYHNDFHNYYHNDFHNYNFNNKYDNNFNNKYDNNFYYYHNYSQPYYNKYFTNHYSCTCWLSQKKHFPISLIPLHQQVIFYNQKMQIYLNEVIIFTQIRSNNFIFSPIKGNKGDYSVTVTVTNIITQRQSKQSFKVEVQRVDIDIDNYSEIVFPEIGIPGQKNFTYEPKIYPKIITAQIVGITNRGQTQDILEVKFVKNYFFINNQLTASVQRDQKLKRNMPQQFFNSTAMIVLENAASSSQNTFIAAIFFNFFLQLASKFSMKFCSFHYGIDFIIWIGFINYQKSCKEVLIISQEDQETTSDSEMLKFVTVVVVILLYVSPLFIFAFIHVNQKFLGDPLFNQRYGTFYLGMKVDHPYLIFSVTLFFFRRIVYGFSCTYFSQYSVFQMFLNIMFTLQIICYNAMFLYLDTPIGNQFEIINEIHFLFILILIMPLIGDIIDDVEIRYQVGWVIVLITMSFMFLNLAMLFYKIMIALVKLVRLKLRNFRINRLKNRQKKYAIGYNSNGVLENNYVKDIPVAMSNQSTMRQKAQQKSQRQKVLSQYDLDEDDINQDKNMDKILEDIQIHPCDDEEAKTSTGRLSNRNTQGINIKYKKKDRNPGKNVSPVKRIRKFPHIQVQNLENFEDHSSNQNLLENKHGSLAQLSRNYNKTFDPRKNFSKIENQLTDQSNQSHHKQQNKDTLQYNKYDDPLLDTSRGVINFVPSIQPLLKRRSILSHQNKNSSLRNLSNRNNQDIKVNNEDMLFEPSRKINSQRTQKNRKPSDMINF
eukprot:403357594